MKRVTREIKILKRNRHQNIIQLYEVLDTPTTIFLIMENADGGEMFNYIVSHQRVEEKLACGFFHQLVDGVEYLHQMEVTHRDLKPENLLLQSSKEVSSIFHAFAHKRSTYLHSCYPYSPIVLHFVVM